MEIENLRTLLVWCLAINYVMLMAWFGVFVFAREGMHPSYALVQAIEGNV